MIDDPAADPALAALLAEIEAGRPTLDQLLAELDAAQPGLDAWLAEMDVSLAGLFAELPRCEDGIGQTPPPGKSVVQSVPPDDASRAGGPGTNPPPGGIGGRSG